MPDGIGDVNNKLSLRGLFYHGKKTLESIIQRLNQIMFVMSSVQVVIVFSRKGMLAQALRENGFRVDSSVCPGRSLDRDPAYFDFRAAPRDLAFFGEFQIKSIVLAMTAISWSFQ